MYEILREKKKCEQNQGDELDKGNKESTTYIYKRQIGILSYGETDSLIQYYLLYKKIVFHLFQDIIRQTLFDA